MVLILQIARFLFLFFFFSCVKDTHKSIVSLLIVGQTSSSPFQALFFHIFSLKFLLLRLTLADHSFFFSNIHWSKYYLFQLIVNKQTNKSLSLNGGVPDKDFLAWSGSLRNMFFGPPVVLCNIQARLDSRCRHVFHRTGSCKAFPRTCHLNSGRPLSSDWRRCT